MPAHHRDWQAPLAARSLHTNAVEGCEVLDQATVHSTRLCDDEGSHLIQLRCTRRSRPQHRLLDRCPRHASRIMRSTTMSGRHGPEPVQDLHLTLRSINGRTHVSCQGDELGHTWIQDSNLPIQDSPSQAIGDRLRILLVSLCEAIQGEASILRDHRVSTRHPGCDGTKPHVVVRTAQGTEADRPRFDWRQASTLRQVR